MTKSEDEEILNFYDKMKEFYGEKLPNFEHYPKSFIYYIKLYQYYMKDEKQNS